MVQSEDESFEAIQAQLKQLSGSVQQIPQSPSAPESVLSILGEARSETSWEALLEYFLDPAAPNGMETDVLEAFFDAISKTTQSKVSPRSHHLSAVEIESQISVDDGVPDLLLWVPGDWFCCVELKSHSGESDEQTLRYAASESIGSLTVSDFEPDDRHYIYLTPSTTPLPASDEFVPLDWEAVVDEVRTVLNGNRGRYPVKSSAQLADFLDTIEDELNMTEQERYQREKAQLVIDHNEALNEVQTAFEDVVKAELAAWEDDFADVSSPRWNTYMAGQKYARAYRDEWVLQTEESSEEQTPLVVYELQIDKDNLRTGSPEIILKRTSGVNQDSVYDALYEDSIQNELQSLAPRHNVRILGRSESTNTLELNVDIELAAGETVGGQFATRIKALDPINQIIDRLVADFE